MKIVKSIVIIMIFCFLPKVNAQESRFNQDIKVQTKNELSYYQQRGLKDAQHEQQLKVKGKNELRKNNRRAYNAYLQAKKDGYAAHHNQCDIHCNHSNYWYQNAAYYYYGYRQPHYENRAPRSSINTQIEVGMPRVKLGVF
jgi:hypothetical protein